MKSQESTAFPIEVLAILEPKPIEELLSPMESSESDDSDNNNTDMETDDTEEDGDSGSCDEESKLVILPTTVQEEIVNNDEPVDDIEKTVIEYVMKHDKEELSELLNDFKEEVNEDFMDIVTKLEDLINIFIVSDEEVPLMEKEIFELRRSLESSNLKKSQQQRLKILLDDIQHNRYRVRSIFTRLKNAQDERDITNIVEQLAREELISTEQYEKLLEDDAAYTLATTANIVKDTKIGQGLKFLPTSIGGLQK